MKVKILLIMVCLSMQTLAKPILEQGIALSVANETLSGKALYWKPYSLPLTLQAADYSPQSEQLARLFEYGLVRRSSEMATVALSPTRQKVTLLWQYDWLASGNSSDNDESANGVTYGKRFIKDVVIHDIKQIDGEWIVSAQLHWFVSDLELWVDDPTFSNIRLFKRSKESFFKPFLADIFFVFRKGKWQIWREEEFFKR